MARRRFFVPEVRRGMAELTGADAEHLVRVLRVEAGQVFEITDNQNTYLAEVQSARKSVVTFRATEKLDQALPAVQVLLLPALFKFDRLEWLIEKATELGVAGIYPFEAVRSDRGLAQGSGKRLARWQRIALEASQQSRRDRLPTIEPTVRFAKVLEIPADVRLLLDEKTDLPSILQVVPEHRSPADRVAVMTGPEGGWTEGERQQAIDAGWSACSLSQMILRAETAAIAALAIIQAAWAPT
jgi:16S rRNA (uracil1498-N3)-methyltransferase